MVDMVARLLGHILAVQQVNDSEEYSRYRQQGKEIDFSPWIEKDRRKHSGLPEMDRQCIRKQSGSCEMGAVS